MNKAIVVLALTGLLAGCPTVKPQSSFEQSLANVRCMLSEGEKSLTADDVQFIRNASDDGNVRCKAALGGLYEFGRGNVPQNFAKAKALYESVAVVDGLGYERLARMAEEGRGQARNDGEARRLYQLALTKSDSDKSKLALAKLMEEGRGGPQDLFGAMMYYVEASQHAGDVAWKGIQRIRAQGLVLTPEQTQRYNDVWSDTSRKSLNRTTMDIEIALNKQIKRGSASKPVTLQVQGKPGSNVPLIALVESSGNAEVDQAVVTAFGKYRIPAEPLLQAGQDSWSSERAVKVGLN
ncbi:sel1 repeat family protein [Pseudomonas tolaasii]|uniref:tetratricopeptide repeat protein n=1 Tax=Pseudomonas tolaasii TaxID=29442 RepID=UPI0015A450BD|nr:SEL1-like repeat protein [Pseudomonas tolaasii]MBW1250150.1 sel1 repeat family protein [Pseudomonas tolaasii]NWC26935.1 sel1 repeat family protein [Pseudomonas tolaasii]NWC54768.1 sel1 repeat family protein [Pseudomonas tolaasii]NWE67057.1 sel1 repeat family protein [Pseudomonas tolaasii]